MANDKGESRRVIDAEEPEPVPLDIAPDHVEFIILKARAVEAAVAPIEADSDEPGTMPPDDEDAGVLDEHGGDQAEEELRDAIDRLSAEAGNDLLAMFWVGRGDFGRQEWDEARAQAAEQEAGDLADYLLSEPGLGNMLAEGLNTLGYEPESLDPDA